MQEVALIGLEFYAYHGFYEEERKIGNRYGVDLKVQTDFSKAGDNDKLSYTIDYSKLYAIVHEEMIVSSKLLENVAQRIVVRIFDAFPGAEEVEVAVSKFNPPLGGVCERSRITIRQKRSS